MEYMYALTAQASTGYVWKTVASQNVSGAMTELAKDLRTWAVAQLEATLHDNNLYIACLVDVDDDGNYDTYHSLAYADVLWWWDQDCTPTTITKDHPEIVRS